MSIHAQLNRRVTEQLHQETESDVDTENKRESKLENQSMGPTFAQEQFQREGRKLSREHFPELKGCVHRQEAPCYPMDMGGYRPHHGTASWNLQVSKQAQTRSEKSSSSQAPSQGATGGYGTAKQGLTKRKGRATNQMTHHRMSAKVWQEDEEGWPGRQLCSQATWPLV